MARAWHILAVMVLLVASGCATEQQPPTPSALTDAQRQALADEALDAQWQTIERMYPTVPERPSVAIERFIAPGEYGAMMSACLEEAGYEVEITADGGIEHHGISDQAMFYDIAMFMCASATPIDPTFTQPWSDEEVRYVYDYQIATVVPCLHELNIETPNAPSFQQYADAVGTPRQWSPYSALFNQAGLTQVRFDSIASQCPELPTGFRAGT